MPTLPKHLLALSCAGALAACGDAAGTADEACATDCTTPPAAECVDGNFVEYAPTGTCVDAECRYEAITTACAGGCDATGCASTGPCDLLACDEPPASTCEGTSAVTYAGGTCEDGACVYEPTRVDCAVGGEVCRGGQCVDPSDPCAGVTCDTPPVNGCDGSRVIEYEAVGVCDEGDCLYDSTAGDDCAASGEVCANGACVDPGDPCATVTCDAPPAPTCSGNSVVAFASSGTCDGGTCTYAQTRTNCEESGLICVGGTCIAGGDLCEGVTCDAPPATTCVDTTTLATYSATGTCIASGPGAGTCDYSEVREACPAATPACVGDRCVGVPGAGDLVVNELYYDAPGEDDGREWLELRNASDSPLFVGGVVMKDDGSDEVTLPDAVIEAGGLLVLEDAPGATGVSGALTWGSFTLGNVDDEVELRLGDVLIDRVVYNEGGDPPWPAATGASLALDPRAVDNATPDAWCLATTPISDTIPELGSPGRPNGECVAECAGVSCPPLAARCEGSIAVTTGTGTCVSGGSCDYAAVETRVDCAASSRTCVSGACVGGGEGVAPGDLVITEFYANHPGNDTGFEWLELFNASGRSLELEGIELADLDDTSPDGFTLGAISLGAGEYLTLGESAAALPGGPDVIWTDADFTLGNSNDEIVVRLGAVVIDQVVYDIDGTPAWTIAEGASASFGGSPGDDNAVADAWCTSTSLFDGVNRGTPGAANDACPEPVEPPILEAGDIVITEFLADPEGVSDASSEWFEIYNASGAPIDLRGVRIVGGTASEDYTIGVDGSFVGGRTPTLGDGAFFVFARQYTSLGETTEESSRVDYVLPMGLSNGEDTIAIYAGDVLVDSVAYFTTGGDSFNVESGYSTQLAPSFVDDVANDDPANWCLASDPSIYATFTVDAVPYPHRGTPGSANVACE